MPNSTKICYILPEYDENNYSHFYHLYEFLEKLSQKLDLFLIIEKSSIRKINFGRFKRVYVQKFRFLPFRFLESFLVILRARTLGYKNFYTHYCYIGAINAGMISRLSGGKSYYWNCAMNWLFKPRTFSKMGLVLSLKLSHYLVTGSPKMREGYAEYYNLKLDKIKVIPNRINLERFRPSGDHPQGDKNKKTILFVHWLSKRKGADMLMPIALELKTIIKDFKILVVGEGPYREKLLEEIKENKLEKIIETVGAVPNKDIVRYYKKADIFILPSMEEGFPMSLLEPMAMGIPYVASDVGAVREISSPTAQRFLVKPGEVEKFVQKIEILISDREIYKQFRKEELEKVKEYSMDKAINKFIKLFK